MSDIPWEPVAASTVEVKEHAGAGMALGGTSSLGESIAGQEGASAPP